MRRLPWWLVVWLSGCAPDWQSAHGSIERGTGLFAPWVGSACTCNYNKPGSLGVTTPTVSLECDGSFAPEESKAFVDIAAAPGGDRTFALGSITNQLPSGHPVSGAAVTDAIGGPIETTGEGNEQRWRFPVHVLKVFVPQQRQCDTFPGFRDDCKDFEESTLINVFAYCTVYRGDAP